MLLWVRQHDYSGATAENLRSLSLSGHKLTTFHFTFPLEEHIKYKEIIPSRPHSRLLDHYQASPLKSKPAEPKEHIKYR